MHLLSMVVFVFFIGGLYATYHPLQVFLKNLLILETHPNLHPCHYDFGCSTPFENSSNIEELVQTRRDSIGMKPQRKGMKPQRKGMKPQQT